VYSPHQTSNYSCHTWLILPSC